MVSVLCLWPGYSWAQATISARCAHFHIQPSPFSGMPKGQHSLLLPLLGPWLAGKVGSGQAGSGSTWQPHGPEALSLGNSVLLRGRTFPSRRPCEGVRGVGREEWGWKKVPTVKGPVRQPVRTCPDSSGTDEMGSVCL